MRIFIAVVVAALVGSPALATAAQTTEVVATTPVAAKAGATLRDAKGMRLGPIDKVNADGSVQLIFDSKIVVIPAGTLVAGANGIATTLTRVEVYKMLP